jgi:cytochrome c
VVGVSRHFNGLREKKIKHRLLLPPTFLAACAIFSNAQAIEDIAKKHGCMACHAVDKKVVGPSLNDIAAKYESDPGAPATQIKHVREGTKGIWGATAMPPQAKISDADLNAVVAWILKL